MLFETFMNFIECFNVSTELSVKSIEFLNVHRKYLLLTINEKPEIDKLSETGVVVTLLAEHTLT